MCRQRYSRRCETSLSSCLTNLLIKIQPPLRFFYVQPTAADTARMSWSDRIREQLWAWDGGNSACARRISTPVFYTNHARGSMNLGSRRDQLVQVNPQRSQLGDNGTG